MFLPNNLSLDDGVGARVTLAWGCLEKARKLALRGHSTRFDLDKKPDGSWVTSIDLEIESELMRCIANQFPDDHVIAEETCSDTEFGGDGFVWTLDPIDGTSSFVEGLPFFGTVISLSCSRAGTLFSAIALPALDEIVCSFAGGGAFWKPTGVTAWKRLSLAL